MNYATLIAFRRTGIIAAVLMLAMTAVEARAADSSIFQNFAGTFSKNGRVEVAGGNGVSARGKCRLHLTVSADGQSARLKISGDMTVDGRKRSFTNIVALRRENAAAISNLAPGIDDGSSAEGGSYTASPRSIHADFAFVFGTNAGNASLFVRLKKTPRGTRMLVTQTLATDALLKPITWQFQAISQR